MTEQDCLRTALAVVEQTMKRAYPDAEGERATLLLGAVAAGKAAKYAANADFGPSHPMTVAYLQVAGEALRPITDRTDAALDAALAAS